MNKYEKVKKKSQKIYEILFLVLNEKTIDFLNYRVNNFEPTNFLMK